MTDVVLNYIAIVTPYYIYFTYSYSSSIINTVAGVLSDTCMCPGVLYSPLHVHAISIHSVLCCNKYHIKGIEYVTCVFTELSYMTIHFILAKVGKLWSIIVLYNIMVITNSIIAKVKEYVLVCFDVVCVCTVLSVRSYM